MRSPGKVVDLPGLVPRLAGGPRVGRAPCGAPDACPSPEDTGTPADWAGFSSTADDGGTLGPPRDVVETTSADPAGVAAT